MQDSVLGAEKGAAFRAGATLDSFVDLDAGKPRTLAELRAIEPEYFPAPRPAN